MSEDLDQTPTWAEVILAAMDARLCELHVALPGRVEAYDHETQTADVKPMIKNPVRVEGSKDVGSESLPVVPSVPVLFPRAGDFFVSLPLKKGHFGMLLFNDRSIDRFRALGEEGPPGDNRCHALTGATFLPVALTPSGAKLADAHEDNLVVGRDGGSAIHVRPDDEIHLGSDGAAEFLALKSDVQTIVDAITNAATGAADGGAAYKANMIALLTDPVAGSSKVKAD